MTKQYQKSKKLYCFYRIRNGVDSELLSTPYLYAFTNDKEIADDFDATRAKDVFYRTIKHFDSESELMNTIKFISGQRLVRSQLKTRKRKYSNEIDTVNIVLTSKEEIDIVSKSDSIITELGKHTSHLPFINDEYADILYDLQYFQIYKTSSSSDNYFYDGCDVNMYSKMKPFIVDEYNLLMYLYGGLFMNKKGE